MKADQMLVSKLNRMSEFSDIIDGYLRIENIDILTKNRLIDRINEFSVYCECGNIGDRWIKRDQETGFSLVVSGMTYSLDIESRYDRLADDETALESATKFINYFDGKKTYFTSAPGNPWKGDKLNIGITNAMKDFGVVVVGKYKIGIAVFYDQSCC